MVERFMPWLVAFAVMVPPAAAAQPSDSAQRIRSVLEFEDARFAAMVRGDTAWLRTGLADRLTYIHSSGRPETKSQYLHSIGSGSLRYEGFTARERQVHLLAGGAAAVAGIARARAVSPGQVLDAEVRYLAVYERVGGRWQLVAWQTTRIP